MPTVAAWLDEGQSTGQSDATNQDVTNGLWRMLCRG